ncbi:FmdB family regulatory protein [Oleiphilus messinensis]|uniref:FmdB family regulatory protein n=1 Tax=Oleiphilus messinensis TaxID=141451 RepID=A0A1Y0I7G4_9GAMM|nr:zinc ribbon domain-containing protein [Oleiphilus messinensis]ARU56447.1 FmdB family regulatory protein [Oleiphilus messinensis]
MPVYDYKCREHGLFHELATLEGSAQPCACPLCGVPSPRVIMIPPQVLAMAPEQRRARAVQEKAKHEPIVSTLDSRAEASDKADFYRRKEATGSHGRQQPGQCGCSHEHRSDQSSLKQQVVFLPDGSKIFPSQRPWMISH